MIKTNSTQSNKNVLYTCIKSFRCSRRKVKKVLTVLMLLFFTHSLIARNPVNTFVNNKLHRNANISLLVKDLKTNDVIHSYRPGNATIPASTMKLVTTATALELLGAGYQFKTTLETDGELTPDSVLNGNLYIFGSGDPTLGSAKLGNPGFLSEWVSAVRNAGINRINGDIIADASAYDTEGVNPKWMWEDMGNYFAAGAYGISYKDNTFEMELKSGATGTTPEIVKISPAIPELTFINHLKSTSIEFDSAYFYGAPNQNQRIIYGEIPANRPDFRIKGDIPRAGLVLARDLAWKLKSSGIAVAGKATDEASEGKRTVIYTHKSPALSEIIKEINVNSNNHYAEHLFRHLALKNGSQASTPAAIGLIRSFWKSKGLPVNELFQYDGSGLSPVNAVSANFLVSLLSCMDKSDNSAVFKKSLPEAGKSGTLKNFLKNTPLEGKVTAKSGTLGRVKSYAGYLHAKGKKIVFSIIVNNPDANSLSVTTKMMEDFLISVAE